MMHLLKQEFCFVKLPRDGFMNMDNQNLTSKLNCAIIIDTVKKQFTQFLLSVIASISDYYFSNIS